VIGKGLGLFRNWSGCVASGQTLWLGGGWVDDRALYKAILGLQTPRAVERVGLRVEPGEVEVLVAPEAGTPHACPDCAAISAIYDHVERRWRHLDAR
jgi:hypothetical protein